jgi:hypothetical protein
MLALKQFLTEECANVQNLLDETLRYAYGSEESKQFYDECLLRLESISAGIASTAETDLLQLQALAYQISFLSRLISQIERSHLGEFSWPFAASLKDLAVTVCRDSALPSSASDPLFFFCAEGGLTSYRVWYDPPNAILIRRRISNVVFPRSLKHHVLLHPILGHEVGHAAQAVPKLAGELNTKVVNVLVRGSPLETTNAFQTWLKSACGIDARPKELADTLESWRQELFCDLFGLLLIGPSFVFAHRSLLLSLDSTGIAISGSHPALFSRCAMLDRAVDHLGWKMAPGGAGSVVKDAMARAFGMCDSVVRGAPPASRILDDLQIDLATDALADVLRTKDPALLSQPSFGSIREMVDGIFSLTPPVRTTIVSDDEFRNPKSDFRDILLAGWLAWHSPRRPGGLTFLSINRLCDRAILFERAIARWNAPSASP